ncbi:MAG: glycosyltransferase family 4 protein [Acidobacteriota bacterium]
MRTAAVLLLVRDPGRVERSLNSILPGRDVRPIRREEVQGLGPMALLSRLSRMRAEEFIVLSDHLDFHHKMIRLQALGALAPGRLKRLIDLNGSEMILSPARFLVRDLPCYVAGLAACSWALARTAMRIARLRRASPRAPRRTEGRRVCYLRTDLWSGIEAGGSVAHTAGVATGFRAAGADLRFISTAMPRLVDPAHHPIRLVPPARLYNVAREIPYFAHSLRIEKAAGQEIVRHPVDLIYQRFDAGNHAGVALSRRFGVPFVLEYNGSEVWIADHWAQPLGWRSIFVGLEEINLRHADLIVVVSEALRAQLVERGVEPERIIVRPNGVDPERYRPDLDGSAVRRRHDLEGRTVIGFIGTFGLWHGATVLARSAVRLLRERPDVRFLFVGDGAQRGEAEAILAAAGLRHAVVFTGLVPQEEGPAHLAAMDILAAPHVPNADGTPFFGSPTKLFEYMAMGRGIVASRLDQIGTVLEDGRTALLTDPGDERSLESALIRLVDDPDLRERLGAGARGRALEKHTWTTHVEGIIDALQRQGIVEWK